jgi:hypothetical protein
MTNVMRVMRFITLNARAHTHIHIHVRAHTHTLTLSHTYIHIYTYKHIYTHTYEVCKQSNETACVSHDLAILWACPSHEGYIRVS